MKCIFTFLLDFILKFIFFLIIPIFSLLIGQWSGTLMKKSVTIIVLILTYYVLINTSVVQETFSGWYSMKAGCPFAMCGYEGPHPWGGFGAVLFRVKDPVFLIIFALYAICYMLKSIDDYWFGSYKNQR